jgi:hypothetical protein
VFPKTGKVFPDVDCRRIGKADYALAIASALRSDLKQTPHAVKIVMRWTGANERTVKNWIAGTHGPSGEHLIVLAHHSNAVMMVFHQLAKRPESIGDPRMGVIRKKLTEALAIMDQGRP